MLPSPRMLVALSAFSTTLAMPNYSCKIYLATTPISTQNVYLEITPPTNQSAMTAFITSYTSQMPKNFMIFDTNGIPQSIDVNDKYQIYTQLCTPSTFENGTDVVEFVVHGCVDHDLKKQNIYLMIISLFRVGFDHTYWNFGGNGSENNYVESAIAAGRSVLIYDALGWFNCFITISISLPFISFLICIGVGLSSTPDGITIVQRSVDIEIAAALVQGLKTSWDGHRFGKVIGVGHGYGGYGILWVFCVKISHLTHSLLSVLVAHNFLAWPKNILAFWMEWSSCRAHQIYLHY